MYSSSYLSYLEYNSGKEFKKFKIKYKNCIHRNYNFEFYEEILTFADVVEKSLQQLEGTFAIVVKSKLFPNELVAARRGFFISFIIIQFVRILSNLMIFIFNPQAVGI